MCSQKRGKLCGDDFVFARLKEQSLRKADHYPAGIDLDIQMGLFQVLFYRGQLSGWPVRHR